MRTPSTRERALGFGALAVLVLAVLVAIGILRPWSGDDSTDGRGPTTVSPGSSGSRQADAEKVTASVLGGGSPEPSVASAQGTVRTLDGPQPAIAEVLSVETKPAAILLRWRLKSTGQPLRDLASDTFGEPGSNTSDTADIVLVDPAAKTLAKPARFRNGFGLNCPCSEVPIAVDAKGQVLTGLYPLLAPDTNYVDVRIRGFPPITKVAVTRG